MEYDCAECGLCCIHFGGSLNLYPDDIVRWEEEKNTHLIAIFTAPSDKPCSLLSSGNRCTVYETRPLVCRHFANGGSACRELRAEHGLAL
jgi:Fe-S-cluster containining protein